MENRGSGTASEGKYLYLGSTKLQHIARPGIGECKAGREFTCDEQGILSPLDLHKGRCFSSGGWRISQRDSVWHVMIGWERWSNGGHQQCAGGDQVIR